MAMEWTETQLAIRDRISEELTVGGREDAMRELLKWALARITHYGPSDEPCAVVIREFLDKGTIDHR